METFSDLIERFGGAAKMAVAIGESANTIRQWSARRSIPGRYWEAIVEAAQRLYIEGVTFEALASIAAAAGRAAEASSSTASAGRAG